MTFVLDQYQGCDALTIVLTSCGVCGSIEHVAFCSLVTAQWSISGVNWSDPKCQDKKKDMYRGFVSGGD